MNQEFHCGVCGSSSLVLTSIPYGWIGHCSEGHRWIPVIGSVIRLVMVSDLDAELAELLEQGDS